MDGRCIFCGKRTGACCVDSENTIIYSRNRDDADSRVRFLTRLLDKHKYKLTQISNLYIGSNMIIEDIIFNSNPFTTSKADCNIRPKLQQRYGDRLGIDVS